MDEFRAFMGAKTKDAVSYLKENKTDILKLVASVLAVIVGVIAILWLLAWLVIKFTAFIEMHFFAFMVIFGIILCFVWLVIRFGSGKQEPEPIIDYDEREKQAADRTYVNIAAAVILSLFQKLATVYAVTSPSLASDIYSPARAQKRNDIWYYQYAVIKKSESDIEAVERFLQDELTRMLFDHEAHGIPSNTKFVNGIEYPFLMVDSVNDVGSHILVDIVVITEKYHKLMEYRSRTAFEAGREDSGAEDDEFL